MVTPIKFRSLTDQLYEYLSKSIVEGKITSGEKLVENDYQMNRKEQPCGT